MTEPNEEYKILNMERKDMETMFDIWKVEGFVNSDTIKDPYFNIDPNGYFKGVLGDQVISTILAVRYSPSYAFIGYFIVVENKRHQGYGGKLFQKALEYCENRTIGLIAEHNACKMYEKYGFNTYGYMYEYKGQAKRCDINLNILPYDESQHFQDIVLYDQDCFPSSRVDLLRSWLRKEGAESCVYYDNNHNLQGYASIFQQGKDWIISPCYCDTKEIAQALIGYLINKVTENTNIIIYVPDTNQSSVNFINDTSGVYGWCAREGCNIMYKNGAPNNLNYQKCFFLLSEGVG